VRPSLPRCWPFRGAGSSEVLAIPLGVPGAYLRLSCVPCLGLWSTPASAHVGGIADCRIPAVWNGCSIVIIGKSGARGLALALNRLGLAVGWSLRRSRPLAICVALVGLTAVAWCQTLGRGWAWWRQCSPGYSSRVTSLRRTGSGDFPKHLRRSRLKGAAFVHWGFEISNWQTTPAQLTVPTPSWQGKVASGARDHSGGRAKEDEDGCSHSKIVRSTWCCLHDDETRGVPC
jgi:hypothetical protein